MTAPKCPACGFVLRQIVLIESVDEVLWDQSGMYCPICVATEVIGRAREFDALKPCYGRSRDAELLPASA